MQSHRHDIGTGATPLLPDSAFATVFEPLRGLRVGIVDARGNAGDRMIHAAERQLCTRFGVNWVGFDPLRDDPAGLDKLLIFGGGNMGTPYEHGRRVRKAALAFGVPCILLPQSWETPESVDGYETAFARERVSHEMMPGTVLAPDMALAWSCPLPLPEPTQARGVFLRGDRESAIGANHANDPTRKAKRPVEYVKLASSHEWIITDRLHFAIAGLIARRRVTLLPNSYHKNRSMWETWLADLGCHWSESMPFPSPVSSRR